MYEIAGSTGMFSDIKKKLWMSNSTIQIPLKKSRWTKEFQKQKQDLLSYALQNTYLLTAIVIKTAWNTKK